MNALVLLPCLAARVWAADRLCRKYLNPRENSCGLFPLCLFLGQVSLQLLVMVSDTVPYILFTLLNHLLLLGMVFLFFQSYPAKKLLTASVLIAAGTLTSSFCESFLSCLALLVLHTLCHIPDPVPGQTEEILILCIRTAAVLLVFRQIRLRFHPAVVFLDPDRKWHGILAAPLLGITAVTDVANWSASNGILVRSGVGLGIYYDQLFSHGELCILTALSLFAAGCYLFGMERICTEQQKSARYHEQIAAFRMLEQQYRQSGRLRHDMKNHIIALSGLLEHEEWEKSQEYLKTMERRLDPGTGAKATGNSAVDALLYQKQKLAEANRIRWDCDVQIPPACCVQDFDLCVLFGNLLDNALEACEKLPEGADRFVRIQARPVKKCFLLDVRNRTDLPHMDEFLTRRKRPAHGHGIGLLNVQDVIRQYDGTLHMELQEGCFIVTLLLPMTLTSRT